MASIFVRLPDSICLDIVFKWCEIIEMRNFDCAYCNKSERELIVKILSDKQFEQELINIDLSAKDILDLYVPPCAKNVHIRVDSDCFSHDRFKFLIKNFTCVHSFDVNTDNVNEECLGALINMCVNLRKIGLFSSDSLVEIVKSISPLILSQLEVIIIEDGQEMSSFGDLHEHFAFYCVKLTKIHCDSWENILSFKTMKNIMTNNPNLDELSVRIDSSEINEMLEYVAINGGMMRVLTLNGSSYLSHKPQIRTICKLFSDNPRFKILDIAGGFSLDLEQMVCFMRDAYYIPMIHSIYGTALRSLTLTMNDITESMFYDLSNSIQLLVSITLRCQEITLSSLKFILNNCSQLTSMTIANCILNFSEAQIIELFSINNQLVNVTLSIFFIRDLTWKADTVIHIVNSCKCLKTLTLPHIRLSNEDKITVENFRKKLISDGRDVEIKL